MRGGELMPDTLVVYASIGNSDDKLSQARWSEFHTAFAEAVRNRAIVVHGSWLSNPADPWQNACMAFNISAEHATDLERELAVLAARFEQDSIAWAVVSETEFIGPGLAGGGFAPAAPYAPTLGEGGCTLSLAPPTSAPSQSITINVSSTVADPQAIVRTVREQMRQRTLRQDRGA